MMVEVYTIIMKAQVQLSGILQMDIQKTRQQTIGLRMLLSLVTTKNGYACTHMLFDTLILADYFKYQVEVHDPDQNTTYYYNSVTGEVSWENENLKKHDDEVDDIDANRDNWIVHYDPSTQLTYYENKITLQTQWESPFPENNADSLHGNSTLFFTVVYRILSYLFQTTKRTMH